MKVATSESKCATQFCQCARAISVLTSPEIVDIAFEKSPALQSPPMRSTHPAAAFDEAPFLAALDVFPGIFDGAARGPEFQQQGKFYYGFQEGRNDKPPE